VRRPKPIAASTASYPTLRLGWSLLAAAPLALPSPAHADATIPKTSKDGVKSARPEGAKITPQPVKPKKLPEIPMHTGGVMVMPEPPLPPKPEAKIPAPPPPPPKPVKKQKPEEFPEFDGGMGRVARPRPMRIFLADSKPAAPLPRALVIHPHDPGEPCAPLDRDEEKA
jgi:hypothetical protein